MKFARLASRVAVGGVSAALATAGLVGVTGSSASAAPVSTTYTCSVPILGDRQIPVTVDIALLPKAQAGLAVPAGLLGFSSTITVPADAESLLESVGATGGKSDDFATTFGNQVAVAPVKWDTKTAGATPSDPTVYSGKGANSAFVLPKAGTYAVKMPGKFTVIATKADGSSAGALTCTSATPTQVGTIKLTKQKSTVKAKAPKSAEQGAVVKVTGKVTNEQVKNGGAPVTGKVLVKDGKKTVGTAKIKKKGKFVVKVKGLTAGTHKLKVIYKGDGFTKQGKAPAITVTVTK